MDILERRESILRVLTQAQTPVSAGSLARQMGVSRQIIVGDIALLRTQGSQIISTVRGYTMAPRTSPGVYTGKVVCQHNLADTEKELSAIVRMGGLVLDVVVDHDLYGEIIGQLNIATLEDVETFIRNLGRNKARLLSELTDGIHVHTISCRDAATFEIIKQELAALNLLYSV